MPPAPLYDAHNHLQDARFAAHRAAIQTALDQENIARMVVNGSTEQDWPEVLSLAESASRVIPSFGYHPWYVNQRTPDWQNLLLTHLDRIPSAIGEIGLDRWIPNHDLADQETVFLWQWHVAVDRNLPVSIHCLRAWGRLHDLLRTHPAPSCGFLLHSYGGPVEMVQPLAKLGAYFSFPGYYAHERKERQRATFQRVPSDRLLIETDAPDQLPPNSCVRYPLSDVATGQPLHHPANLRAIYEFVAQMLHEPIDHLVARIESNFNRLFGLVARPPNPQPSTYDSNSLEHRSHR
jgi:TatD DNase family protein